MGSLSMADRYQRPDWVRRLIAMGDAVGGRVEGARGLVPFSAETMLEDAARSVGGGSFGDLGDPGWQARFEELVEIVDRAPLHVVGRLITKQELLRALRSRLLLARALDREPKVAEERIEAPLLVTGPARSGTSITFELLWLDPSVRAPLAWEALHPVPSDGLAGEGERLAASECEQELWADVQPEFAAIHELRSDLPVECVTLTASCFAGPHWPMVVPAAAAVMDVGVFYDFHRRILQALQHGKEPQTWLLKTPSHLTTIDALLATYPDCWVVQTHRDPAKTMPSTVSTTAMLHWMRTDEVDIATLGTAVDAAFAGALNSVAERRASGDLPDRFVDVHFTELLKDPVETLRRAYDKMERPFTEDYARSIRDYLAEKPKGKFGTHKYTPEEWGFEAADLRGRLAPYIDHFDVTLED